MRGGVWAVRATPVFFGVAVLTALLLPGPTVVAARLAPALHTPSGSTVLSSGPGARGWVVQVSSAASLPDVVADARGRGGTIGREFRSGIAGFVLAADAATAASIRGRPGVVAVEPDVVVRGADTQTSPVGNLDRIDQRNLPLSSSYSYVGDGSGVLAYVVDSGIRATHSEFTGRTAIGMTTVNDGLGTADCNGHGTHVAGTLGGTTYGVAKGVTIVPVRVLGCDNAGLLSAIVTGLDWIVAQHTAGTPAVANLSVDAPASTIFDNAVRRVIADGVTTVVAAGNGSGDACATSPARVAEALTVGSVSAVDVQSTFSNGGTCLDVYAPGESVLSAYFGSDTGVALASGTSMAAPAVSGVAALMLAKSPALTPATIEATLNGTATTGVVTGRSSGSPDRLLFLDPTVALSGVLRTSRGTGVSGATVGITRPDGTTVATATTGSTGAYSTRVTTGPLRLALSSPSAATSELPAIWSLSGVALTTTADRAVDLTLPAAVTTSVQVYGTTGAPVSGAVVSASTYASSVSTPLGTELSAVAPRSAPAPSTTDALGRATLVSFPGTFSTLTAIDSNAGATRTASVVGVPAGAAYALPAGGSAVHTPVFSLSVSPLTAMMRTLLGSVADAVVVSVGADPTGAGFAFGCPLAAPADISQATAALLGATYLDARGVTHAAPTGLCTPLSVSS